MEHRRAYNRVQAIIIRCVGLGRMVLRASKLGLIILAIRWLAYDVGLVLTVNHPFVSFSDSKSVTVHLTLRCCYYITFILEHFELVNKLELVSKVI